MQWCLLTSFVGMIMGAAGSTVYYNLRFRHPTLDLPIIDYDLALLFQPMLMLGISIGVAFNVVFAEWMITAILVILFLGKIDTASLFHSHSHWFDSRVFLLLDNCSCFACMDKWFCLPFPIYQVSGNKHLRILNSYVFLAWNLLSCWAVSRTLLLSNLNLILLKIIP